MTLKERKFFLSPKKYLLLDEEYARVELGECPFDSSKLSTKVHADEFVFKYCPKCARIYLSPPVTEAT
jgi:hypothetical protein